MVLYNDWENNDLQWTLVTFVAYRKTQCLQMTYNTHSSKLEKGLIFVFNNTHNSFIDTGVMEFISIFRLIKYIYMNNADMHVLANNACYKIMVRHSLTL